MTAICVQCFAASSALTVWPKPRGSCTSPRRLTRPRRPHSARTLSAPLMHWKCSCKLVGIGKKGSLPWRQKQRLYKGETIPRRVQLTSKAAWDKVFPRSRVPESGRWLDETFPPRHFSWNPELYYCLFLHSFAFLLRISNSSKCFSLAHRRE